MWLSGVVYSGSYGFVNYTTHAEAVQAIVTMTGQMVGNKALKCAWGRHQPRQSHMPALGMLQMQNQLGLTGAQNMLGSVNPMLGMPPGFQFPGPAQMPSPQHAQQQLQQQALMHAQQLQQQALMHAQQSVPLAAAHIAPQYPQASAQQQMLAAHRAQMESGNSLYLNMYGGMYGAP